jgi:type II secretory pathway pseudopilin PulG
MIVSLGIFSIVVTTAVGAMLILISTNQQLQSEQNVMTNLSFALDTMTREIRTGYNYYCSNLESVISGDQVLNCPAGRGLSTKQGISFYEGGESLTGASVSPRILYYYDSIQQSIYRRIGGDPAQAIISSGLSITDAQFYVTGTTVGDDEQPTVTIYLEAEDKTEPGKKYYLQTTVTQRILDI